MDKNKPSELRKSASVYVGVVGPDIEYGPCGDSIRNLNIRKGDRPPQYVRATKGFDARNEHIRQFLKSDHDAILLLDSDMAFAPDTLEKLRSHGMPYISGYYMRRQYRPIVPVMFEYNEHNEWPYEPMTRDPRPGELHRIGASGWGCILVHREVFEAVKPILKGEPFVIEDDMDVWPYDLPKVLSYIKTLNFSEDKVVLKKTARALAHEFRPLRGMKDNIGSDIRFPFFAKQAGYHLYLDASVRPGHVINYYLTGDDFKQAEGLQEEVIKGILKNVSDSREAWHEHMKGLVK